MFAFLRPYLNTKVLCILVVCCSVLMIMTFSPSLFHDDNALQIRAVHQGIALPDGFYVWQQLNEKGIHIKSIIAENNSLVIRFETQEQSVAAEKVLRKLLPSGFNIAELTPSGATQLMSHLNLRKQYAG